MRVETSFHPMAARKEFSVYPGMSLAAIAHQAIKLEADCLGRDVAEYQWFFEAGDITVNGKRYNRDLWACTKPKPGTIIELKVTVHGGLFGKIALVLAAVALTVVTAGIASGGIATLLSLGASSTFAAGGLGASLLAGFVGFAGQTLLKALTPSPTLAANAGAVAELSQAGVAGNPVQRGGVLPSITGTLTYSPPTIVPPYTTLENGVLWGHTMVGLNGRCAVNGLLLNGVDIDATSQVEYDVREGSGAEADTFMSADFRLQVPRQLEVSTFKLKPDSGGSTLEDSVVPDNSAPHWHRYRKAAEANEFHFRLLFDGPIIDQTAKGHAVPFRLRARLRGETAWRNLPQIHIKDIKKAGGFRQELRLVFAVPKGGQWVSRNDELYSHAALKQSKFGAITWDADSYFVQSAIPTTVVPVMTASTTSGVTVSASTEFDGTTQGWKAFDNNTATYWRPSANSLPAWVKVVHAAAKTIRSLGIRYAAAATSNVGAGLLEGTNDGTTWTTLLEFEMGSGTGDYWAQLDVIGSYSQHRLTITANAGAASEELRIHEIVLSEGNSISQAIDSNDDFRTPFNQSARYVQLHADGATIYLDPASWPEGEYEIEIKRGLAYKQSDLDLDSSTLLWQSDLLTYAETANNHHFFDYTTVSKGDFSQSTINLSQSKINSRCVIDLTTEVWSMRPIRAEVEAGLCRIAVRAPGVQIQGISATFTGYARPYLGGGLWSDEEVPCRNPAAYYRDALLLHHKMAEPLPGELIQENTLGEFFDWCEPGGGSVDGFTCDAVFVDRTVDDVLRVLASCGYASTRQGNMYGVVIDRDRSAMVPVGCITSENSRAEPIEINFDAIPHGIVASYFDEDADYQQKEVTVYRAGYSAETATDVRSEGPYIGLTTAAKATARATYNLNQMRWRNITYPRIMSEEAMIYGRGDLVRLADEIVDRHIYSGLIKEVVSNAGFVTALQLYAVQKISESASDPTAWPDIDAVPDVDALVDFGATITLRQGSTVTAAIVEQTDTDTITFVTPIADTGQFARWLPVSIGPLGREGRDVIVLHKEKVGDGEWCVSCIDVANQVFEGVL